MSSSGSLEAGRGKVNDSVGSVNGSTWSSQSKPVHVEIRPRDTYQHHVQATAGDVLSWSFFTRRKNIAFGLFYLLSPTTSRTSRASVTVAKTDTSPPLKATPSMRSVASVAVSCSSSDSLYSTTSTTATTIPPGRLQEIKEALRNSRTALIIHPPASPKPGHGSTSLHSSRANSILPNALDSMHLHQKTSELSRSRTMNAGTRLVSSSSSNQIGHHNILASTSMPDLHQLLPRETLWDGEACHFVAGSVASMSAPKAMEYVEILAVERYESFASTINGYYRIPVTGTYVLFFDNGYSINTPKELFLTVHVGPGVPPTAELLSGWLLKKKRGRLQGWARRWFQLDHKGILSYFMDRFSPCRGSIDLHLCTLTKIPARLMMTIDSEQETYHLRFLSREDYARWSDTFTALRNMGVDGSGILPLGGNASLAIGGDAITAAVTTSSVIPHSLQAASFIRHTERVTADLHNSEAKLGELRELAAQEDAPALQKFLLPLENTFQSLQQLYESLTEMTVFLQRTGRRWSQTATTLSTGPTILAMNNSTGAMGMTIPVSPVGDNGEEFFDAEEIVLGDEDLDEDEDGGEVPLLLEEEDDDDDYLKEQRRQQQTDLSVSSTLSEVASVSRLSSRPDSPSTIKSLAGPTKATTTAATSFRTRMPNVAPPCSVSLSSILRKSIGKDWSTISMPVSLNEPLSALQRLCEELEYCDLLDQAVAQGTNSFERLIRVAAFAVSAYAATVHRAERKPFTPILGETFEFEDTTRGVRFLAEKVVHRPLVVACHAEGAGGKWIWWQDQRMKSKFWGKSMEYIPLGSIHVLFPDTGDHFVWSKVITCVRNLLSGNKWVENYGEMTIRNERTGDSARITLKPNGSGFIFSSSPPPSITNEVSVHIQMANNEYNSNGNRPFLRGRWDSMLVRDDTGEVVWRASAVPNDHAEYFGFGQFAITLNDLPSWLAPYLPHTDSRLRPDQRCLERGQLTEAEQLKQSLEQRQRELRQRMEDVGERWEPRWFSPAPKTRSGSNGTGGEEEWRIKDFNSYWECRKSGQWPPTPSLW